MIRDVLNFLSAIQGAAGGREERAGRKGHRAYISDQHGLTGIEITHFKLLVGCFQQWESPLAFMSQTLPLAAQPET